MNDLLLDTHALYWALFDTSRLSEVARNALTAAESGGGRWYISAITLVEVRYLVEKGKLPVQTWADLLALIDDGKTLRVFEVDVQVAVMLENVPRDIVPDMPDRIIAATALAYSLPLITRDSKIRTAPGLTIIW